MKTGIYALASLSGMPFSPADLTVLGLNDPANGNCANATGLAVRVHDPQIAAIDILRTDTAITVFAGFLDEPDELRGVLGLDQVERPAAMAAAALARFGSEAPRHMLGEWSLLRWEMAERRLTVLLSPALRDLMYFAQSGGLIAVAPSAMVLTELPWVGRTLDAPNLALNNSRAALRHIKTDQTRWRGVRLAAPGTLEVFTANGRTTSRASDPESFERFRGSFDEAVEAIEATGRRIVRQHLARQGCCAVMLSGGLDSTLLASWGAYERGPGRELFCVSSIGRPGSNLPDEREWSTAAAAALGLSIQGVWPSPDADPYRPSPEMFAEYEGAPESRFLVLEQLVRAAKAGGATTLIQGSGGEMHVSNGFDEPERRSWLRIQAANLRDRLARRQRYSGWPENAFHLRFSRDVLEQLPAEWGAVWRKGPPGILGRTSTSDDREPLIGISPIARKIAHAPTSGAFGVRFLMPYRDWRLLRLTTGMPQSFLRHEGMTRPIARVLLKGRVPDAVRLRKHGLPFCPDYVSRLKAMAPTVKSRLPVFHEAGVQRWLDLAWLPATLDRLAASQGEKDYDLYYAVHNTVLFAEFLLWASTQNVQL